MRPAGQILNMVVGCFSAAAILTMIGVPITRQHVWQEAVFRVGSAIGTLWGAERLRPMRPREKFIAIIYPYIAQLLVSHQHK
jgi:hypothetical protein